MSAEIINSVGPLVTVRVSEKLAQPELSALQRAVGEIIKQQGRIRLLIVAENFDGWEREGDWGDLSFQLQHDKFIEKMAIVGNQRWKDLALIFAGKGVRKFRIEYFDSAENNEAMAWLAEPTKRKPAVESTS